MLDIWLKINFKGGWVLQCVLYALLENQNSKFSQFRTETKRYIREYSLFDIFKFVLNLPSEPARNYLLRTRYYAYFTKFQKLF